MLAGNTTSAEPVIFHDAPVAVLRAVFSPRGDSQEQAATVYERKPAASRQVFTARGLDRFLLTRLPISKDLRPCRFQSFLNCRPSCQSRIRRAETVGRQTCSDPCVERPTSRLPAGCVVIVGCILMPKPSAICFLTLGLKNSH